MKKVIIFALMAAGLVLGSCQKNGLDPLSGNFLPAPTLVNFTKVDNSEAFKDDAGRWTFALDLSDASSNTLHAVLIGNKYFLGSNTYTEAPDATAKNGNFISGSTTFNGKPVDSGRITVRENGTNYTVSGVLFTSDGTPYKFEWSGELVYEEPAVLDPQYTYTDAVAQDCTLEDGATLVTDVESHTLTLKDLAGEFAAQIKLIRATGTSTSALAGTYTVKEYAHEDYAAGNGFDLGVYFGMSAGAYVIGSYYVADDGTVVIIEPGATISVTDMGEGVYSIDGDGFSFLCAPEGFVPGGGTVYDMEDTIAQDCTLEDGQTPVTDVESHTLVMKDEEGNFVAQMKLIRALGATDLSGTYTVKEYAHEDFAAGNGFDLGVYFGMDPGAYVIGSYYVADGAVVIVEPGETIEVSKIADDTYKFVGSTDWTFTGKLKKGDTPGPVDPGTTEDVELKEFLSLTDYGGYGMKMVGIELGTAGFYYQPADWVTTYSPTYPVDGKFLKLELYSEDGTVAPGTYVCSAANGTVNAGEFNLGADNGWGGFNGTSLFTVASGKATGVAVADGTVTVSKSGDEYTIELKSSAVNAKYVGKLSQGGAPAGGVTIDGDMSDWAGITGTVQEVDASSSAYITEVKGAADADNIYVYIKRAKQGRWSELWGGDNSNKGYYYYDFDMDNNPETGDHAENDHGKFEAYTYLYIFGGSADAPVFRATPPGTAKGLSIDNVKCAGVVTADAVETEIAFPRADLPAATGNTISVSVWGNKDGNPFTKVTFNI